MNKLNNLKMMFNEYCANANEKPCENCRNEVITTTDCCYHIEFSEDNGLKIVNCIDGYEDPLTDEEIAKDKKFIYDFYNMVKDEYGLENKMSIWKDPKVELPKEHTLIDGTIEVACIMYDEYIIDTPYFKKMNTFNLPNGYYEDDIKKWCYKADLIKQIEEK